METISPSRCLSRAIETEFHFDSARVASIGDPGSRLFAILIYGAIEKYRGRASAPPAALL